MVQLAQSFRPGQTFVHVNQNRIGCNSNIFKAVALGFLESDYNIHFEDDTIPGRDCLKYFEWAKSYERNSDIFTVSAYVNSNNKTEHYRPKSENPSEVFKRQWFTPWGWATWKDRFYEMKSVWDFVGINGSWDCTVNFARKKRYEICPAISRVQNVGSENATHVPNPEWHKTHHYNEYWIESIKNYQTNFKEIS